LNPHLPDLGDCVYQLTATSLILAKTKSKEARDSWFARASVATAQLKGLVRATKYPLWGLSEHLQLLSRAPDWMMHKIAAEGATVQFETALRNYQQRIDNVIHHCYKKGRSSTWMELRLLSNLQREFEMSFRMANDHLSLDDIDR